MKIDSQVLSKEVAKLQSNSSDGASSKLNDGKVDNAVDSDRIIDDILDDIDINLVKNILIDREPDLNTSPAAVEVVSAEDFISKIWALELDWQLNSTSVSSDLHVSSLDSILDDLQGCFYTEEPEHGPDCY